MLKPATLKTGKARSAQENGVERGRVFRPLITIIRGKPASGITLLRSM